MKIEISVLQSLLTVIESKNLSIEAVIALINGETEQPKSEILISADDIKLSVDYTKTVEQAIADGKYDWKNDNITASNFPISGEMIGKKVDIIGKLFHFNRDISSEDAIKEMDKEGFRPATLMELLALGAAHPELQRQFPIIALGSVWLSGGIRRVPYLDVLGRGRGLGLGDFDGGWGARYRFLGVRK